MGISPMIWMPCVVGIFVQLLPLAEEQELAEDMPLDRFRVLLAEFLQRLLDRGCAAVSASYPRKPCPAIL